MKTVRVDAWLLIVVLVVIIMAGVSQVGKRCYNPQTDQRVECVAP